MKKREHRISKVLPGSIAEELEIPFTFASNSLAMNAERRECLASYNYDSYSKSFFY